MAAPTVVGPGLSRPPRPDGHPPHRTPRRPRRAWFVTPVLVAALALAVATALGTGSVVVPVTEVLRALTAQEVSDPRWQVIVLEIRLPAVVTAASVGAALGVAGLQMQTLFRNPLAEPYILGASSGASLGVAAVVLTGGSLTGTFVGGLAGMGRLGVVMAAAVGSGVVLSLVLGLSRWVRSSVTLLLVGVMTGSVTAAAVSLLVAYADPEVVQVFLLWGMGSFSGTSVRDLTVVLPALAVGILLAGTGVRALNALLLGEGYASSMGIDVARARRWVLASAALLTGAATAYCGPIGFLGLVVPHLARYAFGTSNHRVLLPGVCLIGALLAVVCGMVSALPGRDGTLPLNAVTAVIGAPVVIAVLVRGRGAGVQGAS